MHVDRLGVRRVIIVSDSMYVNDNHGRAPYWKKDKWKNLSGRPVENHDLWNEFLSLRPKVRASTEIQWVRGKSAPILQEVDQLLGGRGISVTLRAGAAFTPAPIFACCFGLYLFVERIDRQSRQTRRGSY
jgi:hypothetical protein